MELEAVKLQARLHPLKPAQPTPKSGGGLVDRTGTKGSFSKTLATELAQKKPAVNQVPVSQWVEFSAHAQARLQERNITLTRHNLDRLDRGVQLAEKKGSVNTLVLMDDTAFIVSVKNRKVITAITRDAAVDNVFTQIDSATIV